ncbi:MAG TPA: proton-conducting transporter membrane subunit [Vicinamibacteria bacterium]|nr:proton-conducting transporter membrane subunit [Vicinamibacteria bacterium]
MTIIDFFVANRPLAALTVSLLAVVAIWILRNHANAREFVTLSAAVAKFAIVLSMLPRVLDGEVIDSSSWDLVPGYSLHLRADALGMVFALLASVLWIVTSIYSIGYMRSGGYRHQTTYFASFAVCLSATIGIAFAANVVTFVVFYEILTIATYPLVVHRRTVEAIAAGRKYLVYTLVAGQALLVAVLWTANLAPGAAFEPGGFLSGTSSRFSLSLLFVLFIAGVGVKAAIMPLHGWLPAAMVAPTPVSALLHAVAVVKAGTFACLRIVGFVFGVDLLSELGMDVVLALAAGFTILFGSIRALGENHLKRRLAYSTVSQLSYIVLGAALGSFHSLAGAIFHMVAHGFMKITLFFCAGSIYTRTHKEYIAELGGLGRSMPVTFAAFTLGALGLSGMPLLVGFVSKWNLGLGALEAGAPAYLALLVVSGLLNFAYFFPIVHAGFFRGEAGRFRFDEASPALWIPLALTAVFSIVLGVAPDFVLSLYRLAFVAAQGLTEAGPILFAAGSQ